MSDAFIDKLLTGQTRNALGQPLGLPLGEWRGCSKPSPVTLSGRYCRLEALSVSHAADLWAANGLDVDGAIWSYLGYGPFAEAADYQRWVDSMSGLADPLFYAIVDGVSGKAVGVASYLRIDAANGVIEVGHLNYSPLLQRTPAATEAMYLMMRQAFELGYRRYEWKCNALNLPSRRAAERLGFQFEGLFRQMMVIKGHNRDTAWYSLLDSEWPVVRACLEQWLAEDNFDAAGRQRQSLMAMMRAARQTQ